MKQKIVTKIDKPEAVMIDRCLCVIMIHIHMSHNDALVLIIYRDAPEGRKGHSWAENPVLN